MPVNKEKLMFIIKNKWEWMSHFLNAEYKTSQKYLMKEKRGIKDPEAVHFAVV